jgi:hypothetical protein
MIIPTICLMSYPERAEFFRRIMRPKIKKTSKGLHLTKPKRFVN